MARFRRNRWPRLAQLSELAQGGATLDNVGAVGLGLLEAERLGLPIQETWVLAADAFRDVVRSALPPAHDPASLLRIIHRPAGLERAARARERLLALSLPDDLCAELESLWLRLSDKARWGLRLRASSTCQDATVSAMSGLECELLGIRSVAELERGIRLVWSACVHADTLRYLRGCKFRDIAQAVVIDPLDAVAATGLLMTEGPRHVRRPSDSNAVTVEALPRKRQAVRIASTALGLGAPVVDGAAARDLIRFSSNGEIVEARIAAKTHKLVVGEQGPEIARVDVAKATRPALKSKALAELLRIADVLDSSGSGMKQANFNVLRGGGVFISDLRDWSGAGWPEGGGATTVWSRAGLGESLPGVPTPLTGSLAQAFEERGLHFALASLGCKAPRGPALVRRVHGRFYVNLSLLVPALCDVPGVDPATLIELVGGEGGDLFEATRDVKRRAGSLARLPVTAARLLAQQRRLNDEVQRFEQQAEQQRRWLSEMDLAILPDDALKTTLLETHHFFQTTGQLLLSSSVASLAAHIGLKTVLARSTPVGAERLAQIVTSGVGELESSAPGIALAHVVAIVQKDLAAAERLISGEIQHPSELPLGPARRAISQFLEAYGERAVRESELMTPRWSEAPGPVLAMIVAGLAGEPIDPDRRLSVARVNADRELAALEARVPYVEKVLVRALVSRARVLARLRERMRIWMARTLNMLRIVTLDVDRRLCRLDVTLQPGAAFYCTFDELVSAVGSYRADLGPIIRLRQAGFERDAARLDPPETFVGTPPPLVLPPLGSVVLHGAACSSGVVTGRACLIASRGQGAATLKPGEILVTRTLDVGLSPLFLVAGGLVSELGGALSHGGVVAREYGVPTVVGVPSVTTTVQNGERLRIDGNRGVVERLDA